MFNQFQAKPIANLSGNTIYKLLTFFEQMETLKFFTAKESPLVIGLGRTP